MKEDKSGVGGMREDLKITKIKKWKTQIGSLLRSTMMGCAPSPQSIYLELDHDDRESALVTLHKRVLPELPDPRNQQRALDLKGEQNETNTIEGENIGDAVDHFLKTRVSLSLSRILHGRLLCNGNRAYPLHCGWALTARDDNPCRHRRLEKLYFLTASRVPFSNPPHISKFWTFPVVQLFLTCISSLAIYVMGKYASYEFKRMKAVAELKKKEE
ncbi:uncharacterized protein LOC114287817 [Camellia sinensis]|uniref:uncharacterized protein LOC114287817 n=1 Tax=Camellia sinensis TaxID=4442 RepID=UPI001035545A|nr:uncharacterized protein LOC114287817 [Camellia sinensis]